MAEKINLASIVDQLQAATSPQQITKQAALLADGLSQLPVAKVVLASAIVKTIARSHYDGGVLSQGEFVRLATQANARIYDAKQDLGEVGGTFAKVLEEEGVYMANKIVHGTGAPLDEETYGDARRLIVHQEFEVPPRVLQRANTQTLRRMSGT